MITRHAARCAFLVGSTLAGIALPAHAGLFGFGGAKTSTDSGSFDSATYLGRSEEMLNASRQRFATELAKARQ